jgi:ABC-type transporter Mla subunit MlaD
MGGADQAEDRAEDRGNPHGASSVSSVLANQLSDLARELQQEDDVTAVLSAIVDAALDLIPGTAHASISLVTGRKKVDSQVASGDLARQVDALQNSTGQGPLSGRCLQGAGGSSPGPQPGRPLAEILPGCRGTRGAEHAVVPIVRRG